VFRGCRLDFALIEISYRLFLVALCPMDEDGDDMSLNAMNFDCARIEGLEEAGTKA
jgi:hypothetical protein